MSKHRRQLLKKGSFVEFIVPEALKKYGLPKPTAAAHSTAILQSNRVRRTSLPSGTHLLMRRFLMWVPTILAGLLPKKCLDV